MRASIGRRLAATVAIAVGVAAVVTSSVSVNQQFGRYVQSRKEMLLATGSAFSAAISAPLAARDRNGVFAALRGIGEVPHLSNATARDRNGIIVGQLGYGARLDRDPTLGTGDATSVWSLLKSQSITVVTPVVDDGAEVGELQLVSDADGILDGLLATLGANMAGAGVALLAGLLVAVRLQRSITRPLTDLTATMKHVQERHNYDTVLPPQDGDEVGTLIDGFNAMLSDIRERDLRLVRHRDRLEQDVADRTRDLRSAMTTAEEANAAKSTFLATMSHEIRTPMTGLLVMAELLASSELPGQSRRYAEVISKSGSALLAIINDILDFSKIEAGKLETERVPVDVRDVVETVVSLFYARAREKGLDLTASFAADVPLKIEGDPVRLQQVVGNLVNNALKFTQVGSVSIDVFLEDGHISIAVKDTGIGIPDDKLGQIFEAFSQADGSTTRQFGGTGLGLSIASRLAQAMQGQITARSGVGQGSTFTCSLLLSVVEAAPAWPRLTNAPNEAVVDVTAPATAHTLSAALRRVGYIVSMGPESNVGADVALRVVDAPRAGSMQGHRPGTIIIGLVEPGIEDLKALSAQVDLILHQPLLEADLRAALKSVADGEPLPVLKVADGVMPQHRYDGAKVLVVDDTAVNREVMVEALRRFGIVPDLATNGLEAITAATRTSYDLIYMDGSMPELDGFEACRRLRGLEAGSRRTPVLALTAHVVGVAADAWQDAGMDGVLHKPFSIAELQLSLAKHLNAEIQDEPQAVVLRKRHDDVVDVDTLFDEGVLAEIASVSEASGQDFARRVFRLFIEHAPQALNTATIALAERDQEAVARAAHAIKSMSLNIGAKRVGICAKRVETTARDGEIAPEDIAALGEAVGQTIHDLSSRFAAMDIKLHRSA